jgi:hypothetical protein
MMMMILIIMMAMIGRGLLPPYSRTNKCTSVPNHPDKMIEDPIATIIIGTLETGTTTATTIFDETNVKGHDH